MTHKIREKGKLNQERFLYKTKTRLNKWDMQIYENKNGGLLLNSPHLRYGVSGVKQDDFIIICNFTHNVKGLYKIYSHVYLKHKGQNLEISENINKKDKYGR